MSISISLPKTCNPIRVWFCLIDSINLEKCLLVIMLLEIFKWVRVVFVDIWEKKVFRVGSSFEVSIWFQDMSQYSRYDIELKFLRNFSRSLHLNKF